MVLKIVVLYISPNVIREKSAPGRKRYLFYFDLTWKGQGKIYVIIKRSYQVLLNSEHKKSVGLHREALSQFGTRWSGGLPPQGAVQD